MQIILNLKTLSNEQKNTIPFLKITKSEKSEKIMHLNMSITRSDRGQEYKSE